MGSRWAEYGTPGSDLAVNHGCTCAVLDNRRGRGRGDGLFYISLNCPVHGDNTPAHAGKED